MSNIHNEMLLEQLFEEAIAFVMEKFPNDDEELVYLKAEELANKWFEERSV